MRLVWLGLSLRHLHIFEFCICIFFCLCIYVLYSCTGSVCKQCRSKCNKVSLALLVTQAWLKIASSSERTKERIRRGALSNCASTPTRLKSKAEWTFQRAWMKVAGRGIKAWAQVTAATCLSHLILHQCSVTPFYIPTAMNWKLPQKVQLVCDFLHFSSHQNGRTKACGNSYSVICHCCRPLFFTVATVSTVLLDIFAMFDMWE